MKHHTRSYLRALAALTLLVPSVYTVNAASLFTWTQSTSGTQTWTTAANWDANGVDAGPGTATDVLNFFADTTTALGSGTTAITTSVPPLTLNTLNLNGLGNTATAATVVTIGTLASTWTLDGTTPTVSLNGLAGTKGLTYSVGVNLALAQPVTTFTGNGTGTFNFNGVISGATSAINKTGTSAVTLAGTNTYGGGTTISAGTLTLAGANTSSGATNLNGGTLTLGNAGALGTGALTIAGSTTLNSSVASLVNANNNAVTVNGDFTFTGSQNLNLGTGAISLGTGTGTTRTITTTANTLTLGGNITDGTTANGLIKAGSGTLTLSGTNSYTGATTVNAGILSFANTAAKAAGTVTAAAAGTIGLGVGAASGDYSAANVASLFNNGTLSGFALNTTSGVAIDTTAGNFTQSIVLTGSRALTKIGANTLTLSGVNTYTGGTIVNEGTVLVQNNQTSANGGWGIGLSNATVTNSTVTFDNTSTVAVKSGKSIQVGANSAGGTIPANTLTVNGTVNNSGSLFIGRGGVLNLSGSGATWSQSGTGTMTVTGQGGSSAALNIGSGAALTYNSTTATPTSIVLNAASGSGGSGSITIDGGLLTTNAGFVNTASTATGSGQITLKNGGTLKLSAGVAALTTQNRFNLSAGVGVIDNGGFNTTLSGIVTAGSGSVSTGITGGGSLTSQGSGSLTLSGVNTYTGATTVAAGKLAIASTGTVNTTSGVLIGAGEFNYNSATALSKGVSFSGTGGTLSGTGTISSAVSISTGNTVAAGIDAATIGTLSFGSTLTGASGATFSLKLNSNSLTSDKFAVTGVAALGSATLSLIDLGTSTLTNGETFTLLTASSVTGSFLNLANGAAIHLGNTDYTLNYLSNAVTLTAASAIPEPATYAALAGLGILAYAAYRRRKAV